MCFRHIVANHLHLVAGDEKALRLFMDNMRSKQATHIESAILQPGDRFEPNISSAPLIDTDVRGVFSLRAPAKLALQ